MKALQDDKLGNMQILAFRKRLCNGKGKEPEDGSKRNVSGMDGKSIF